MGMSGTPSNLATARTVSTNDEPTMATAGIPALMAVVAVRVTAAEHVPQAPLPVITASTPWRSNAAFKSASDFSLSPAA